MRYFVLQFQVSGVAQLVAMLVDDAADQMEIRDHQIVHRDINQRRRQNSRQDAANDGGDRRFARTVHPRKTPTISR